MFVHYYMTVDPVTIHPDQTVAEAIAVLDKYNFRHLPVVDDDSILLGMLTDRRLRSALPSTVVKSKEHPHVEEKIFNTPVSQVMADEYLYLTRLSTLDRALLLLQSKNIAALPVLNETRQVIGIFSAMDLMKAYRGLFGLGEKGSSLVCVEDTGDADILSKIARIMEEHHVDFSRLIRSKGGDKEPPMIYLRINTYNIRAVHKAIEEAGFTLHVPKIQP
ncbi:MAG: hypothetical protein CSA32_04435 [Desulfobulbus propionicus]|nr:MAG: hypothetical protein CSA32_04435 [Desulfobulbus propionicus]